MTPALRETLVAVASQASDAADPWWIIGSAAVALVGGAVTNVGDVDLLMAPADASRFLRRLGSVSVCREPDPLFRSDIFGTWNDPPLTVEVFAGFCYFSSGSWRPVWPITRVGVAVENQTLFVPSANELKALLLGFGRAKDMARAALMPA